MSEDLTMNTSNDDAVGRLRRLALEYHERAEAFDRVICRGNLVNGIAMPRSMLEKVRVNRNAAAVIDQIMIREGVNPVLLKGAIADTAHEFEQTLKSKQETHDGRLNSHNTDTGRGHTHAAGSPPGAVQGVSR